MNYKKSYIPSIGYTKICKIGECSLKQLEFGIIELNKDDTVTVKTENKETAFIFLGGHADVSGVVNQKYVGSRNDVFGSKLAWSIYVGRNSTITFKGCEHVKIAVCGTPIEEDTEAQILPPEHVVLKTLGVKPWERETSFIIDGNSNAKKLTIGEAYVTPGNWAGFPPHKHDTDNMPFEGVAEEIYYFLFQPEQGFAVQCMYKEGKFDESYRVKQDDLVEFPEGFHTTVAAPGYNAYFLWLMAGEYQGFYRSNDPEHNWISAVENMIKKQ